MQLIFPEYEMKHFVPAPSLALSPTCLKSEFAVRELITPKQSSCSENGRFVAVLEENQGDFVIFQKLEVCDRLHYVLFLTRFSQGETWLLH